MVAEIVLLVAFTDWEWPGCAAISLIIFGALLQLCGNDVLGWIIGHPFQLCFYIGLYFVAGTLWSIVKWGLFVREERAKYDDFKARFLKDNKVQGEDIPDELKDKYLDQLSRHYGYSYMDHVKPSPTTHKARILTWMTYWPWSALWTILNDPIRKAFTHIYYRISVLLQKMSDAAFKGTEKDFTPPPKSDTPPVSEDGDETDKA